jgi:DNA-binding CsgD family transcriptional regulator
MSNPWHQDNLTNKQKEYLALIASGASTLQAAESCYVSEHTVRNTIVKAKERVGAKSTVNLVAMAIDNGWIKRNNKDIPHTFSPC